MCIITTKLLWFRNFNINFHKVSANKSSTFYNVYTHSDGRNRYDKIHFVAFSQNVSFLLSDENPLKSFHSFFRSQKCRMHKTVWFYFCRFIVNFISCVRFDQLDSSSFFSLRVLTGCSVCNKLDASASRSPHRRDTLRHDRPHTCRLAYPPPPPPTCVFLSHPDRGWIHDWRRRCIVTPRSRANYGRITLRGSPRLSRIIGLHE